MSPQVFAQLGRVVMCSLVMAVLAALLFLAQAGADEPPKASPLTAAQQKRLAEAQNLMKEARQFYSEGKIAQAARSFEKVLEVEREVYGEVHEEVAESLETIAGLRLLNEEFAKAREKWQEALELRIKLHGKEHYTVTNARLALANVDLVAHLSPQDRASWHEAQNLGEQAQESHYHGRLREALPLAKRALEIQQRLFGENHPDTIKSLHNLGVLSQELAEYAAGRHYLEQALKLYPQVLGASHPENARTLNSLGSWHRVLGNYAAARTYYERSLAIRQGVLGERDPDTARSLNSLGLLLKTQGDYVPARAYYEGALAIRERTLGKSHPDTAESLNNLALLLEVQGDAAAARSYLERAVEIRKHMPGGESHPDTAQSLDNLGLLLYSQGNYAAAQPYIEQALAIYKKVHGENHPDTATAFNNRGLVLDAQAKYEDARQCFEQALSIEKRVGRENHPGTALILLNLGSLMRTQKNYTAARSYYLAAQAIQKKGLEEGHPDTARTLRALGDLFLCQGDYGTARLYYEQALLVRLKPAQELLESLSEAEALAYVETIQSARDPLLSVLHHSPETTAAAYAAVWNTRALASRAMATRRDLAGKVPQARELWEQLRSTRVQLAGLTLAVPPPDRAKARQEQLAKLNANKEQLERELAKVSLPFRRQQRIERASASDLATSLPGGTVVLDLLQISLHEPSAGDKAELKRTPHYEAFVLRKAPNPGGYSVAWIDLGAAEPIDRAVRTWQRSRQAGTSQSAAADAPERTLRRLVWEPVDAHLTGCSTVVIIPDAALCRVPWAALPGKKPGTFLLEEYAIATASHGQQLYDLLNREPLQESTSLVVGGVHYDATPVVAPAQQFAVAQRGPARQANKELAWQFLAGSLHEAEQIAALWKRPGQGVMLSGKAASEAALREHLPRSRYVHLATHGFFADPAVPSAFRHDMTGDKLLVGGFAMSGRQGTVTGRNPLILSGVVLAGANLPQKRNEWGAPVGDDGILTAEEVVALDLSGTELAVLSACDTSLGEVAGGEGVFGLQRAFHLAGASTVVASLWKVDDRATQALMTEFYRNLWHKGQGKLQALREAQLTMLRLYEYEPQKGELRGPKDKTRTDPGKPARKPEERLPPLFWAAFVLSGDWR